MVCPPTLTVTVAVPAARLLPTSNPTLGKVLTAANSIPGDGVSVISVCPLAQAPP
jgi:hypothetical protein